MIKAREKTETPSRFVRISECIDELKDLLVMSENESRMLDDLCQFAIPTCSESIRLPLLDSLSKDLGMLFASYYRKVISCNVRKSAKRNSQQKVLDVVAIALWLAMPPSERCASDSVRSCPLAHRAPSVPKLSSNVGQRHSLIE